MQYKSLDHAKHNEQTCDYLYKGKEHSDWVITTAFYSALHYLRHKIFPLTINKEERSFTVNNFEEYCAETEMYGKKHNTMRKLVEDYCSPEIAAAYNHMLDISWTARYSQYKFSLKVTKVARKRLVAIRNYATKQA